MRKSIKALLATGLILLPLTACDATDTYEDRENKESYSVAYALEKNHEYTLTNYDFLSISTDRYQNNNGRIYKFSITTTNFYVVENIGKKDYGEYYIWYYSPNVSWSLGNSYNIK